MTASLDGQPPLPDRYALLSRGRPVAAPRIQEAIMASQSGIRIALGQFNALDDEKLRFAAQLGVSGVQMNTPKLPGEQRWEVADLRALVDACVSYGLTME